METNIGKEILEKPEDFVVIKDREQLLQAYPNLFEKINIDLLPFYIEKPPVRKDGVIDFSCSDKRYVLTPSGIVRISSKENETIWGIDDRDTEVFNEMNIFATEQRVKEKGTQQELYETRVEGKTINMMYFPYNDSMSANNVMSDLKTNHLVESINNENIE